MPSRLARLLPPPGRLDVKVPAVTAGFWGVKLLTTGLGEAASDWLAGGSLVLAAAIGLGGLVAALAWQLRQRRYRPAPYWTAVLMVAVFGTMAADGLHQVLDIPYPLTTAACVVGLAAVFAVWRRVEGTLDIHSVRSSRREAFYWCAVLATFALGTAVGDLTAYTLDLGYLPSAVGFAVAIAVPAVAWLLTRRHEVLWFWTAYVLTRPLGASLADWLGKPAAKGGGLGLGDGTVTLVGLALLVAVVLVLGRRWVRAQEGSVAPPA